MLHVRCENTLFYSNWQVKQVPFNINYSYDYRCIRQKTELGLHAGYSSKTSTKKKIKHTLWKKLQIKFKQIFKRGRYIVVNTDSGQVELLTSHITLLHGVHGVQHTCVEQQCLESNPSRSYLLRRRCTWFTATCLKCFKERQSFHRSVSHFLIHNFTERVVETPEIK